MKHGDFTDLAKFYGSRPGYSKEILYMIKNYVEGDLTNQIHVADIGAGTGKLTEDLVAIGITGVAIEPNRAMRNEGKRNEMVRKNFEWCEGSAENTGMGKNKFEWGLMGSSFHWTNAELALKEISRILKKDGYFTALWNPRLLTEGTINHEVEKIIQEEVSSIKRISSGNIYSVAEMTSRLCKGDYFGNVIYCEGIHTVEMKKERYIDIWKSVNDVRVQAGEERFARILQRIEEFLDGKENLIIPYQTRAWTAQVRK